MHVLVGRGGELAAPCSLVCDDPDCACRHSLTALDSRTPVELVTVAERPEITEAALTEACADFLAGIGFTEDPTTAACAQDMATTAIAAAADWPAFSGSLALPIQLAASPDPLPERRAPRSGLVGGAAVVVPQALRLLSIPTAA